MFSLGELKFNRVSNNSPPISFIAAASRWSQNHREKYLICPTSMNSNFMMKTRRKVSIIQWQLLQKCVSLTCKTLGGRDVPFSGKKLEKWVNVTRIRHKSAEITIQAGKISYSFSFLCCLLKRRGASSTLRLGLFLADLPGWTQRQPATLH